MPPTPAARNLEAEPANPLVFCKAFQTLNRLYDTIEMRCYPSRRLVLTALGARRQILAHVTFSEFTHYSCATEACMYLPSASMARLLKCVSAGDTVRLASTNVEKGADQLELTILTKSGQTRDFTVTLASCADEPRIACPSEAEWGIRVPAAKFYEVCKNMLAFEEPLLFACQRRALELRLDSQEATARVLLRGETEQRSDELPEASQYSLENVLKVAPPLSENVRVEIFGAWPRSLLCKSFFLYSSRF